MIYAPPSDRDLRVAFLIPALSDGGAQIQCLRLLENLAVLAGLKLSLVYFNDGVNSWRLRPDLYDVLKLPGGSNFNPINILRAARTVRELQPDVLFTWLHAADVYGFFIRLASSRLRWLMSERDSAYPRQLRYLSREYVGRHATAIACNSDAGRRYWSGLRAKCPIHVVSNIIGPVSNRFCRTGRGSVLSVGRLESQKNPLVVAEAFCAVAPLWPGEEFLFVGEGSYREKIARIVDNAEQGDRVRLLGFRSDAALLIGSARLVVTLSHHEGTPNVVLEAVAAGVPVVASDILEHRSILGDDYPFLVAQRTDASAAAEVIIRALDADVSPDLYAYARARLADMSGPAVASRYREIFEKMLTGR